jgi:cytochrome c oxidase subunit 4
MLSRKRLMRGAMSGHDTSNPVVYYVVFAALIGLTVLTVLSAQADVGAWHTPIALAIAVVKAALVVLIFMHALRSERLTWVVIIASALMLLLLVIGVLADYWTRTWLTS